MIDLLVRREGLAEIGQKYKGRVQAVSVVAAVIYLVMVAVSAGWWMWVNSRKTTVMKEREMLVEQLGRQADTEAVVRAVVARVEVVEAAIARPKLGPVIASAQTKAQAMGLEVVGLKLGETDTALTVTVRGTSLSALEDFAKNLEVKLVTKRSEGIWDQEVVWK